MKRYSKVFFGFVAAAALSLTTLPYSQQETANLQQSGGQEKGGQEN